MCISCCTESDAGREQASAISRRSILAGIGALAAAAGVTACASPSSTRPLESAAAAPAAVPNPDAHFEIVLLGTQAGPPIAADRTGISTALVVDGTTYVVDCGRASATQYRRAGLQFATLRNIFITHLHADHIADYYNFFMLGGGTIPQIGDGVSGPVDVYGPGPAGGLPQAFGGRTVPVTHPADPTPGLAELTRKCTEAYAYSNNVLMRDTGLPDTSTMPVVHEIALPELGADFTNTCPPCTPFTVMSDDRVHVTATLVPHGPHFPPSPTVSTPSTAR